MTKHHCFVVFSLLVVLVPFAFVTCVQAQAPEPRQPAQTNASWLWLEQFAGSTNANGQVFSLTSTAGYNFNSHFGAVAGLPVYFVRPSASTTSSNGVGDFFAGVRLAFPNPAVNYRMTLIGTVPTGDSSTGVSTGHATYDWTNHFDRSFGRWTPYANLGLSNSIPESFLFQRPFASFGHLAHFEAGAAWRLVGPLNVSASAYDIEPWGTQEVFSRVVRSGGPPAGMGRSGRVFELNQQTTGGASLTRDHGFNAGLNMRWTSLVETWVGFSRSVNLDLNTVSFGVGVNMTKLLGLGRVE